MKDIKTKKNLKRILLPSFFIIGITAIPSNGISSLNQSLAMVQTGSPAIHGNNNSSKMMKEKMLKDKIISLTTLIIKSNSKAEEAKNSAKKALLGEAVTLNELADELDKEAVETYEKAEELRKVTDELVDLFGEEEAYKFLDSEAADIVLDEAYKAEDKLRKVAVELRKASELKLLDEAYKAKHKVAYDLYEEYKAAYEAHEAAHTAASKAYPEYKAAYEAYEAAHTAASKAYPEYKAAYEAYTAADITDENRIPKQTLNEMLEKLTKATEDLQTKIKLAYKTEAATKEVIEVFEEKLKTYEIAEEFRKVTDELVDLSGEEEAYKFLDSEAADIVLDEAYKAEDKLRKVAVELQKASELKLLDEEYKAKHKVAYDLYEKYEEHEAARTAAYKEKHKVAYDLYEEYEEHEAAHTAASKAYPEYKAAYEAYEAAHTAASKAYPEYKAAYEAYEAAHTAASKAYPEYKAAYEAYTAAADITDENRIPKQTLNEMLEKLTKLTEDLYTKIKLAYKAEAATKEVIKVFKEKLKADEAADDMQKAKDDMRKAADETRKTLDEMQKTEDEARKEEDQAKTELKRYKNKEDKEPKDEELKKAKKKILSSAEKKLAKAQEELNIKTYKDEELTPLLIRLDTAQDEAEYEIKMAEYQAVDSEKKAGKAEQKTPEAKEDTEKLRLKLEKKHTTRIFENQKLT